MTTLTRLFLRNLNTRTTKFGLWAPRAAICALLVLGLIPIRGQRILSGEIEIREALERLDTLGSVMMIGAHPDDEDTRLLAWLARGQHVDAAYLSLTRGDGGQMFKAVCKPGLEGIVATKLDAPYRSGPSKTWNKVTNPKAPAATRPQMEPFSFRVMTAEVRN